MPFYPEQRAGEMLWFRWCSRSVFYTTQFVKNVEDLSDKNMNIANGYVVLNTQAPGDPGDQCGRGLHHRSRRF